MADTVISNNLDTPYGIIEIRVVLDEQQEQELHARGTLGDVITDVTVAAKNLDSTLRAASAAALPF